ncbi:hypothetical protein NEUTE1DRAFT_56059 [Neurospora tetrasperma FGSC 2508]|uniref:Uncharacterized protein n=1 Tax=Neurospora tetrasperma (strain FGSC 2508 / ATCC MYA-4615 / P0657) TaxID=510951 RepID=F8N3M2_NEUT8|nr:uncharacterized protein NEUTE1DRAFT_56059 [Neurospora tetrasperma FGSC 2508]EGO53423.1 hypothetical protein NEUTE1DRAFT_56059 [Neurospora tetrasperma FGSC 2508]
MTAIWWLLLARQALSAGNQHPESFRYRFRPHQLASSTRKACTFHVRNSFLLEVWCASANNIFIAELETWICAGKLRFDEIAKVGIFPPKSPAFKCQNPWTRKAGKPAQLGWEIDRSQLGEFKTPRCQDMAGEFRNVALVKPALESRAK